MADANIEVYAVVDKSKKNQKSFMLLPNEENAETDSPPPIPERSEALEYSMITADTAVDPGTEKKEGAVLKSVSAAAVPVSPAEEFDNTYSTITVHQPANPEKKGEGVKMDADSKPTPEGTLQHPTTTAPAKSARSFYSMVTLDTVHSTVNDGDLQQQPAETDMGTGKGNSKAADTEKQEHGTTGCKTAFICSFITIAAVVIIALIASVAFLYIKVGELEVETASLQPGELAALDSSIISQLQQISDSIERINNLNDSINQHLSMSLTDLKHELSEVDQIQANRSHQLNVSVEMRYQQLDLNTEQMNRTIEINFLQLTDDITKIESKTELLINYLQIGQSSQDNPLSSCASIVGLSPSGYYWVRTSNDSAVHVYCDMTRSCGGVTGGWVRVAYLDKTNSSQNGMYPSGLSEHISSTVHTCIKM